MRQPDLHSLVATIDAELSQLSRLIASGEAAGASMISLQASWAMLIRLLGVPAHQQLRMCPRCRRTAGPEATRCTYCWTKLGPHISEA